MRPLPIALNALLFLSICGCTSHEAPVDAVVADLRAALVRSLAGMGEPAMTAAALDNLAGRLAWQSDATALAQVRDGTLPPERQQARARAVIRQIESHGQGIRPPAMLVWLAARTDSLPADQRLLLEACIEQAEREEPKSR